MWIPRLLLLKTNRQLFAYLLDRKGWGKKCDTYQKERELINHYLKFIKEISDSENNKLKNLSLIYIAGCKRDCHNRNISFVYLTFSVG